jgi:hypothetical protein
VYRPPGRNDNGLPEKKQDVSHKQFTYLQETADTVWYYYVEKRVSHTFKLYGYVTAIKI